MLELVARPDTATVGHGNLWVLTRVGDTIEIRMAVDPPESEPIDIGHRGRPRLWPSLLRSEVVDHLAARHELDDRHWSQMNPYR